MTDWKENERKQIINALNRIADNLGRIANGTKVKGRWKCGKFGSMPIWTCSERGTLSKSDGRTELMRYCPYCGSEMENGTEENNDY